MLPPSLTTTATPTLRGSALRTRTATVTVIPLRATATTATTATEDLKPAGQTVIQAKRGEAINVKAFPLSSMAAPADFNEAWRTAFRPLRRAGRGGSGSAAAGTSRRS